MQGEPGWPLPQDLNSSLNMELRRATSYFLQSEHVIVQQLLKTGDFTVGLFGFVVVVLEVLRMEPGLNTRQERTSPLIFNLSSHPKRMYIFIIF